MTRQYVHGGNEPEGALVKRAGFLSNRRSFVTIQPLSTIHGL